MICTPQFLLGFVIGGGLVFVTFALIRIVDAREEHEIPDKVDVVYNLERQVEHLKRCNALQWDGERERFIKDLNLAIFTLKHRC